MLAVRTRSATGRSDFIAGLDDYAASDVPFRNGHDKLGHTQREVGRARSEKRLHRRHDLHLLGPRQRVHRCPGAWEPFDTPGAGAYR